MTNDQPTNESPPTEGGEGPEGEANGEASDQSEFGIRVLRQLLDLYVTPEINRRQAAGELKPPLQLRAAQIIFFPDGRPPAVHVNEELAAEARMKLKDGVKKLAGEPIYESEVERIESLNLTDPQHVNCGHATLMVISGSWHIAFDFRYNKQLSRDHLDRARQFLDAATFSIGRSAWASAVDNMFSAAELCSKALLIGFQNAAFASKTSHGSIHSKINQWAKLGNVKVEHVTAYNRLGNWRAVARYPQGPFALTEEQARDCLAAIEDMYAFAAQRTA
jgi:HEPN domain-containing protein